MFVNLTNDMTRLCGEIAALRDSRADLISRLAQGREDLKEAASQKQAEFRSARADMADRTRTELQDFVGTVKDTVTQLKQGVVAFREEFLEDLVGAHRAWSGHSPLKNHSRMAAKEQPKESAPKGKKKKH